jgi:hypothetical protein
MIKIKARSIRIGIRFTIGIGVPVLLLLFGSGVASATDADVKEDGPGSLVVHISGLGGPGYVSGADTCSVWLDRDPANSPDPTGGGPAGTGGTLDFHKLAADVSTTHTVWIKCYHANKQEPFWEAQRGFTPSAPAAAPPPAAAPEAPAAPAPPAAASLNGVYFLQAASGEQSVWTVTSCGPVCLHIQSNGGWEADAWSIVKGHYTVTVVDPNGGECPDGAKVAMTKTYSFDAGMTGGTRTAVKWDGCAGHGGGTELPPLITFTMTKTSQ